MVMLLIMVIAVSMAPSVFDAVDDARQVRTRNDLSTIAVSVTRMVNHVWGDRKRSGGFTRYSLLVGPGTTPAAGTTAAEGWDTPAGSMGVGMLDEQLVANAADYAPPAGLSSFGWRGPYIEQPVGADPWGQRYAVNVGALLEPGLDTIVISAGADGRIDAPFARDGGMPAGDDLAFVVAPTGSRR